LGIRFCYYFVFKLFKYNNLYPYFQIFYEFFGLKKTFIDHKFENGDTRKQILARSRYLLFKPENKWTPTQRFRAEILFENYPDLQKAHKLCMELGDIYNKNNIKGIALTKLAKWYDKVEKSGFKTFKVISQTIQNHYQTILNYFERRSTNASVESFNAKIKAFRSQFRGVRNIPFFLFRLSKINA